MKSIYSYYKERLIEISGKNRSLYIRSFSKKTGYDLFVRDLAGCPGENLLAAAADRDQAAFARTFRLESETVDLPRELPGEEVAEGSAGDGVFMIF